MGTKQMAINLVKEIETISKSILNHFNPEKGYEIFKRLYGLEGSKVWDCPDKVDTKDVQIQ